MRSSARIRNASIVGGICIGLVFSAAACSQNEPPKEEAKISVRAGVAHLDPGDESIAWPLDQYALTVREDRYIYDAVEIEVGKCMRAAGRDFSSHRTPGSLRGATGGSSDGGGTQNWYWGIWGAEQATKWGYESPPGGTTNGGSDDPNFSGRSEDWFDAYSTCGSKVNKSRLSVVTLSGGNSFIAQAYGETFFEGQSSPSGKKATRDFVRCATKAGLNLGKGFPYMPKGIDKMSKEQELKVAALDVGCKEKTKLVQRMADAVAAYQLEFIRTHEAALVTQRKKIDDVLRRATAIIAADAR